jgi:hypothetical protein
LEGALHGGGEVVGEVAGGFGVVDRDRFVAEVADPSYEVLGDELLITPVGRSSTPAVCQVVVFEMCNSDNGRSRDDQAVRSRGAFVRPRMSNMSYCERCGERLFRGTPCEHCFDGLVDARLVGDLVGRANSGDAVAERLVAGIVTPDAAPELIAAIPTASPELLASIAVALGATGGRDAAVALAGLVQHPDDEVCMAAASSLAELATTEAADSIAVALPGPSSTSHLRMLMCLAELRDPRALRHLRALLPAGYEESDTYREGLLCAIVRVGDAHDVMRILGDIQERMWIWSMLEDISPIKQRLRSLWAILRAAVASAQPEVLPLISEAMGSYGMPSRQSRRQQPRPLIARREVPKWEMALNDEPPVPDSRAKFGGQPDWLTDPEWPVVDGRKLTFYGQLPIAGDDGRMAYIFIGEFTGVPDDPTSGLNQGNVVVVQPNGRCLVATTRDRTGPQLWMRTQRSRVGGSRLGVSGAPKHVALSPGLDPATWEVDADVVETTGDDIDFVDDDADWNKLGGTPLCLQGDEAPEGVGWHFAFQFGADWAGHELGDGAIVYGFVHDDGRGHLVWQCH